MTPENLVRGRCQADQDALSFLELGALRGTSTQANVLSLRGENFPKQSSETDRAERERGRC